jgi:hypothetical protein
MVYNKVLLPKNRSIALLGSELDCRFSGAALHVREDAASARGVAGSFAGCVGGTEAPRRVPDRRQGAVMIHSAKIQRQVDASVLPIAVAAMRLGCEPPL